MRLFLVMQFKVRMRVRFYRKYGYDYETRQVKYMQRHFTFYTMMQSPYRLEEARDKVLHVLFKKSLIVRIRGKFRAFSINAVNLQRAWRAAIEIREDRMALLTREISRQTGKLVSQVRSKLANHKPGSKEYKNLETLIKKLDDLSNSRGDVSSRLKIEKYASLYIQRMKTEYMLDYAIWRHLVGHKKIQAIKDKINNDRLVFQNPEYQRCVFAHNKGFQRMKYWTRILDELKEKIYDGTEIVDTL